MFTSVRSRICLFQNLWRLVLLITIFLDQAAADVVDAENNGNCPPSSCGEIHGITYPFRLDTDTPNCGFSSFGGDKNFTLYCHNNSSLFLYPNNISGRFLVKGINYDNFTIHLVDPGVHQRNCSSLPISPIPVHHTFYPFDFTFLSRPVVLISCDRKRVNNSTSRINKYDYYYNSYFVEITAPCKSKIKKYSYVIVGENMSLEREIESCSIDMITLLPYVPFTNDNVMYQEIHRQFSDGFLLSWFHVSCGPNCNGRCYPDEANRPTCSPFVDFSHDTQSYDITTWFVSIYYAYLGYSDQMFDKSDYVIRDYRYRIAVRFLMYQGSWVSVGRWYWVPIFKIIGWLMNILILLGALRGVIFLLGSPCVFVFLIYQWRRRHLSLYNTIEEFLQNHNDLMPIRYSYKEIKKMTSYFKDKLGEGGFGCVYKGKLRSDRLAAIKILGKSSKVTNGQDFMNEVATIGRIHHVNVVQLVGYCAEQSNRALVYDFMPNGSLDKYIFPKEGFVSLCWDKLFEISVGVARGIEYLHHGCDMQILHFDLKPHNILLDENFIPKVSDFGLAKLYPITKDTIASLTAARGTIGYMAPELFYKNIGRVSYKADVYSFGMLLLEIAGKRKNLNALVEKSSQIYFPSWVYDQISNGDDIKIGDNATKGETKIVKKMIIVGLWCIQMKPSNRPSMNKVVEMLEGDAESLEIPPKSALCPEEMPNVAKIDESSNMSDNSSESISLIESAG